MFLRYIGKPHKRCSGLFSVALSSELDAAIVTKCHGIKICQEFHRECQTYVIPPKPSILPTKRYSWWNLFCIFAASENPVETKIEMQSEIPSIAMVGHGLQHQNLLYLCRCTAHQFTTGKILSTPLHLNRPRWRDFRSKIKRDIDNQDCLASIRKLTRKFMNKIFKR